MKWPVPSLRKTDRTRAEQEHEVLVAVVVDVGEERVLRVLQDAEPGALRHVLEGAVAAGPVQPVGKPVRLADVHVLQPVPVDVGDRDAVVAVRVAGERRVERRPPVVEADAELPSERVDRAEGGRRHLGEDGYRGAAAGVAQGRPLDDVPAGRSLLPAHLPPADALDAVGRAAGTHEVVAHLGAGRTPLPVHRERGDQELGGGDLAELPKQPRELRDERPRVEDRLRRHHPRSDDLERRRAGDGLLLPREQAATVEAAVEQGGDGARRVGALSEPRAQLREPRDQLPGHPLVREEVAVARGLAQEGLQRLRHRERRPVDERLARATAEAPPGPEAPPRLPQVARSRAGSSASPASRERRGAAGARPTARHGARRPGRG